MKMTIKDIVERCGGKIEVCYRLGKLHTITIDRWYARGIPLHYWEGLMRLAAENGLRVTPAHLYEMNQRVAKKD